MILVADDEPLVRRSLHILLTTAGFKVVEAANADEALARLEQGGVSLILSDINMPGNSDLAFVRAVAERFPGLPLILSTGYPTVETAVESVNLSVAAYLLKPLDAEKVLSTVRLSIGHFEARENVRRSLVRLNDWSRDLRRMETLMGNVRASQEANAPATFLELNLRHLMASLLDLQQVVSALAQTPSGKENVRSGEMARALEETVEVLERTKRAFKSKDLRDLREKLEAVLASADGGSPD